ncbi:hypothetical protein [Rhodobacter aestuarii]|uniref:hypothetical protein n=1 Tax=Rhodobacter aestuarii TaxID=453582 RepID=UPI00097086BE|nr:hypothetical protein [Rhodobacter aestuarii]
MTEEADFADQDLIDIGAKIVEMADRVRTMNMALPGALAQWHFEMDDLRYKVTVSVAGLPVGEEDV